MIATYLTFLAPDELDALLRRLDPRAAFARFASLFSPPTSGRPAARYRYPRCKSWSSHASGPKAAPVPSRSRLVEIRNTLWLRAGSRSSMTPRLESTATSLLHVGVPAVADISSQDLNVPPIKTEEQLVAQLIKRRDEIRSGTALFNGVPINFETELTRFVRATGFLHLRIRTYSGYHVVDQEPLDALRRTYIISSLILGWWSIPFGVIDTVSAVGTNMRGGIRSKVSDLIGGADVVKLTKLRGRSGGQTNGRARISTGLRTAARRHRQKEATQI